MPINDKPIANASVILREKFDELAVLFDPDTGIAHGMNPLCVFIWKRLDGNHNIDDILEELKIDFEDVPAEAKNEITEFIENLVKNGLAGYEVSYP
jgi:SynChlorMet cassette protein ScmD